MTRGKMWGNYEMKALLQIWADNHFAKMLVKTHTNNEVLKFFSDTLKEWVAYLSAQWTNVD